MRFSTVAGNKGSGDLARDVRGFAVKLYTREGNWDVVGNNIPVEDLHPSSHSGNMRNPRGRINYEPNSWGGPREDPGRGFVSYPAEDAGAKRRLRPESFADHYSQARQSLLDACGSLRYWDREAAFV